MRSTPVRRQASRRRSACRSSPARSRWSTTAPACRRRRSRTSSTSRAASPAARRTWHRTAAPRAMRSRPSWRCRSCSMARPAASRSARSGLCHQIEFTVDALRQAPVIRHRHEERDVRKGTSITVAWPESAGSMLAEAEQRFLQIADDYTWLNPHLALTLTWFGERSAVRATDPSWRKWRPSDPTCPHWYTPQHLERLIAAYLTHDVERGRERTVREFVSEFRGLSGSLKQKAVLAATGLQRAPLAAAVRRPHDRPLGRRGPARCHGRAHPAGQARSARHHRQGSPARAGSRRPGARWRASSTSRSRARTPGCPG